MHLHCHKCILVIILVCTSRFCSLCVYSDGSCLLCVYLVCDLDGARGVEQARMDEVARAERVRTALTHSIMTLASVHRPQRPTEKLLMLFLITQT